jgi:thioesterase-3
MTVSITPIVVRSTDLDAYGHVNNARYVEYFEWGRFDWLKDTGLEEAMQADHTAYVVVNVNVAYRAEARRSDELVLATRLAAIGKSSLRMAQQLKNAAGVVVAEGEVVLAAFDPFTRKGQRLPEQHVALLTPQVVELFP